MWKQLQRKYLGSTIPVLNIHGAITPECTQRVAKRLSKISVSTANALAVSINSPGGLPVQSQIICNKIGQFASKNNLKVYTFAHDVAASGGYFILSTGHKVYADTTSIIGNIGVIIPKYQLNGFLDMTSLQHKSLSSNKQSIRNVLNPFHNLTPQERQQLLKNCGWIHQKFIQHVKKHRGNKLKNDNKIFTGQVYTGVEAKQVGLVDQVGSMVEVLEKQFPGSKLDIEGSQSWARSLIGL